MKRALGWLLAGLLVGSCAHAGPVREWLKEHRTERENTLTDLAYGADRKQTLDVYRPSDAKNAPILILVHGGAWKIGDKGNRGVVKNKVAYWGGKGYLVVSVNYRLLPEADAFTQAEDVARALAYVQRNAAQWGGDPSGIVLMGHSAGGHLVALLSADPAIAARQGARRWLGTVALDSAAVDVESIMRAPHRSFYDEAFGNVPDYWRTASPLARLTREAVPVLLVCSTTRDDKPCTQSQRYAQASNALGVRAEVLPQALSHMAINGDLGAPGAYTETVDRFVASLK